MNLFSPNRVEHVVLENSKREKVTRRARTKNLIKATPKNVGVSLYISSSREEEIRIFSSSQELAINRPDI